jgi:hypothetical protein
MYDDPLRIIGSLVKTKAAYVRNAKWVMGRYGSNYKDAEVEGVVTAVVRRRKSDIGPMQCYITALYTFFNGETKEETLHISKIKEVIPPTPPVEAVIPNNVIDKIIGSIDPKNNEVTTEKEVVVEAVEEGVIDDNDNDNNKAKPYSNT